MVDTLPSGKTITNYFCLSWNNWPRTKWPSRGIATDWNRNRLKSPRKILLTRWEFNFFVYGNWTTKRLEFQFIAEVSWQILSSTPYPPPCLLVIFGSNSLFFVGILQSWMQLHINYVQCMSKYINMIWNKDYLFCRQDRSTFQTLPHSMTVRSSNQTDSAMTQNGKLSFNVYNEENLWH